MKKIISYFYPALLFALPFIASAQSGGFRSIQSGINSVIGIINLLIPLIIGLAIVYFLWGVLQYVAKGHDQEKRDEAKNIMIWGIIAIFVMVSVWGLVGILRNTFQLEGGTITYPTIIPGR